MNTFPQILFVLPLFLITACSSSYEINSTSPTYDTSVQEFNKLAKGKEAEIILTDNVAITATDIYLSADTLYWFNTETQLKTGVVKSEVRKITFTNNLHGGLVGAGIGGTAGLLLGVVTVEAAEANQTVGWCAAWSFIGALIGFPIGMIVGYTDEYEFQNNQQQKNSDK